MFNYNSLSVFYTYFYSLIIVVLNLVLVFINTNISKNYISTIDMNIDYVSLILLLFNSLICYKCIIYTLTKYKNSIFMYVTMLSTIIIITAFMFFTNDIFLFFLYYEILLLPSTILCYLSSPNLRSKYVTFYFLFWTQSGSFFLLLSVSYIYNNNVLKFSNLNILSNNYIIASALFISFSVKIPTWPFHFWLTKTHVEVNTSFSIFLSGVLVKIALIGFYKFIILFKVLNYVFIYYCFVSIFDVVSKLFLQVDFKKIVAYCTIFEMNIILINIFVFNFNTIFFLVLFSCLHTTLSNIFFLINDFLYKRNSTRNIKNINSLYYSTPLLAVIFLVSILLFNGLPFTLKFSLELLIFYKLLFLDFFFFTIFFFLQITFTLIFNKLNYTVLFSNIKNYKIKDISKKEFYFILINIPYLLYF